MSQLAVLLIVMFFFLILCLLTTKEVIISPQFGFTACFIPGIVYAFFYVNRWNLDLSFQTMKVIILGVTVFIITSVIAGRFFRRFKFRLGNIRFHEKKYIKDECLSDSIPAWKINTILILELLSLVMILIFLMRNFGSNIPAAIYSFRVRNRNITSSDYVTLPGFVRLLRRIALAAGMVIIYLFFNGIVYKSKKNRIAEIICIFLAFVNGLILGGRGEGIQLITTGLIIYFLMQRGVKGGISLRVSDTVKIFTLAIIIIASFAEIGSLLGRQMDFLNFSDYIAVYLSAELKNLDLFIRQGVFGTSFQKSQTMINVVNALGSLLGQPDWIHNLDNPYHYIGNIALGNVSTTFYAFMYDGGYIGVVGYTALFAAISQIIFQYSLKAQTKQKISLSVIIYSYVWYTIVFSFFSDKFYEIIFNTAFLWTLFSWILLLAFFNTRVSIKLKGIRQ